jgi:PAS domain S-box-containing protein
MAETWLDKKEASGMHKLASTLRDDLGTLVEAYDLRLQEISDYADMPDQSRLEAARYDLELVAACLEAWDDNKFVQFIRNRVGERLESAFASESLLQALTAIEETITPLVATVEEATFLWRAFSQARTVLSQAALEDITERTQTNLALQESEERYRDLFENANDLIQSVAPDGSIVYVNRAWRETLGYSEEEIPGLSLFDVVHPDSMAHCMEMFQHVLAGETLGRVEAKFVTKDGRPVTVEGSVSCKFRNGNPVATRGIFRDITERKRAEEKIKRSRETLQTLLDAMPFGVVIIDKYKKIRRANNAALALMGYTLEEQIVGMLCHKTLCPAEGDKCPILDFGQELDRSERILVARGGKHVPILKSVVPITLDGEDVLLEAFVDITEHKQAEEGLRQLSRAVEATHDAVVITDVDGRIQFVNWAFEEITGYSQAEALGENPRILKSGRHPDELYADMWRTITSGRVWQGEMTNKRKDGALYEAQLTISPMRDAAGKIEQFVAIQRDVTEHKRVEAELKTSEERFRSVVQTANDAIISGDNEGNIVFWNPTAEALFGYPPDEVIGKPLTFIMSQQFREMHESTMGKTLESTGLRKDGSEFPIELSLSIWKRDAQVFFTAVVRNITERKQVEEAIRESEERFRRTFEVSAIGKVLTGLDGQFHRINDSFCQMFGYTEEELLSKTVWDITHPDDVAESRDYAARLIEGELEGDSFTLETRYVRKDDRIIWGRINVALIRDPQGNPLHMSGELEDFTESKRLEQEVRESLERRTRQVQTSTEIAQEIAAATELSELFRRVVTLVKDRFGYYHVQIFRHAPEQDALVMVEGYGAVGEKMKAAGHGRRYGEGVVGTAAATGEPVLASDISQDPHWVHHPDLPDTEGELAVPITLRDRVLGILDVQSDTAGALTEEDQVMLLGLAGQIASAIEGTRLRQEMEENLRELERLTRTMSREGWEVLRREMGPSGYLFDQSVVIPADDFWTPEIGLAMEQKALVPPASDERPVAVTPLSVRGEIIGALGVQDDPRQPLSREDLALLESVSEQVAQALESARLLGQTQTVLAQTEALYEGSNRVIRATTTDDVLQALIDSTSLSRLGRANIILFDRPWDEERTENAIVAAAWERAASGEESRAPVGTIYPIDEFPIVSLIARDKPVIFGDIATTENIGENLRTILVERLHMRSLVVFPLAVGEQWIGILTGQASTVLKMSEDEVRQIASLADQAASVIQNQRLLEQAQTALEEVEATHRLYLRERWARFVPARVAPLHERTRPDVPSLGDDIPPEVKRAMMQRKMVVQSSGDDVGERAAMVAPITLRGEVIGALGLHETGGGRQWTDDEVALIESVADQIALAIENVRLLEETQRRAQRERLVADITAKVRSSSDVETILRTAVRELGAALGTDRARIQLGAGTQPSRTRMDSWNADTRLDSPGSDGSDG